jgi:hypothetical protein
MSTKNTNLRTNVYHKGDEPIYSARLPGVKNFADVVPASDKHRRFDEMIDQTIYIVNIEPMFSEQYGAGFRIWAKDMPNEQDSFTVASFSQYNRDQLQALYNATHNGDKLLPNTCVKAVVRAAGKSYRLE